MPNSDLLHADHEMIAVYVDGLVLESAQRRSMYESQCDANLRMYLGDQWEEPERDGETRLTLNRIQNAVISAAAVQTEESPKVVFVPREQNDIPLYYVNINVTPNAAVSALLAQLPPETYRDTDAEDGSVISPRPLTDTETELVQQAVYAGQMLANQVQLGAAAPNAMQPMVPPEFLVSVSDREVCNSLQTVFDSLWEECDADFFVTENLINTLVVGWQFMLYEWDDRDRRHYLRNPEFLQIHIDPIATDIATAQYAVYDQVMSADQACAQFPDLSARIREYAIQGIPQPAGSFNYRNASVYSQLNFQREMVVLRTCWIRNQPYPMTLEQALACGSVVPVQLGVDGEVPPEAKAPGKPEEDTADPVAETDEVNRLLPDPPQDKKPEPEIDNPMPRMVYMLPGTETQVQPGDPAWPNRNGIRQMRIIAERVVDDRECEFGDIPLAQNVNIPIMYCPYGQGEPFRLQGIQTAINAILSDMVTFYNHHAMPCEFVPESVNSAMPEMIRNSYIAHAQKFIVPDQLLTQLQGKLMFYAEPPPLPPDAWKLFDLLLTLVDKESGNQDVLQGRASASWSGVAIDQLQHAAKGPIGLRSRRTEKMLKYLAGLMVRSIIDRMSVSDWQRYVSKYPPYVLDALKQHAKAMDVNFSVEISSGRGAARAQSKQLSLTAYNDGLLSAQTALERLGENPKIELQNMVAWKKEIAAAQGVDQNNAPAMASRAANNIVKPAPAVGPGSMA